VNYLKEAVIGFIFAAAIVAASFATATGTTGFVYQGF
jgi:hypothetical protein